MKRPDLHATMLLVAMLPLTGLRLRNILCAQYLEKPPLDPGFTRRLRPCRHILG